MKLSFTLFRLPRHWGFFELRFLFKAKTKLVIILIFSWRLPLAGWFLNIANTCYSGSLLRISETILETVLIASFPTAFAPEYKRVLTKQNSSIKKDPIHIRKRHPETSHVNRINLTTTVFTYVVKCLSIHSNYNPENYYECFFLKCNTTRHGISLNSKSIFSTVFINRRIELHSLKDCPNGF